MWERTIGPIFLITQNLAQGVPLCALCRQNGNAPHGRHIHVPAHAEGITPTICHCNHGTEIPSCLCCTHSHPLANSAALGNHGGHQGIQRDNRPLHASRRDRHPYPWTGHIPVYAAEPPDAVSDHDVLSCVRRLDVMHVLIRGVPRSVPARPRAETWQSTGTVGSAPPAAILRSAVRAELGAELFARRYSDTAQCESMRWSEGEGVPTGVRGADVDCVLRTCASHFV
jgi:hypothetical protein